MLILYPIFKRCMHLWLYFVWDSARFRSSNRQYQWVDFHNGSKSLHLDRVACVDLHDTSKMQRLNQTASLRLFQTKYTLQNTRTTEIVDVQRSFRKVCCRMTTSCYLLHLIELEVTARRTSAAPCYLSSMSISHWFVYFSDGKKSSSISHSSSCFSRQQFCKPKRLCIVVESEVDIGFQDRKESVRTSDFPRSSSAS